jgi:outer membrane receptor protein involved in Fe transport
MLQLAIALMLGAQPAGAPAGTVADVSGAPIAGAEVSLESPAAGDAAGVVRATTSADGSFTYDGLTKPGAYVLSVRMPGFATVRMPLTVPAAPVRIVMLPASISETVTVTASRSAARENDQTIATTVLTTGDLLSAAALGVDDALRSVPGFSLFRRSSSRVANPTTQGVTLRSLSASGASRTLVLADGVPLNDPFGGWVYWNRVPQAVIDRVEVVRGPAGDLYGADAAGGVIQVVTVAPAFSALRASMEGGSLGTGRVSGSGSLRRGRWSGLAAGEWLTVDGYIPLAPEFRRPYDTRAGVEAETGLVGLDIHGTPAWPAFHAAVRGTVFSEHRKNGTSNATNATALRRLAASVDGGELAGGVWQAQAYGGTQGYDQTFSARGTVTDPLTQAQHIPTTTFGAAGQWTRGIGSAGLLAGVEGRYVESTLFLRSAPTAGAELQPQPSRGGSERTIGAFGQLSLEPLARLRLVVGARVDDWRSDDLESNELRSRTVASPRVSAAWRASAWLTLRGTTGFAFRPPTLNELHRDFGVGAATTFANASLVPERLATADFGLVLAGRRGSARVTGFWSRLDDAIANRTTGGAGGTILRRRDNVGRVRARGLELEGELRAGGLSVTAGGILADARFVQSAFAPLLDRRVPQVPRYQAAAGVRFVGLHATTLAADLRIVGPQFDDDLNQFRLDRAVTLDFFAARALSRAVHVFGAVENVLDEEYETARTPLPNLGLPRAGRVGVRVFLP